MSRAYKFRNPDGIYFTTSTVVQWLPVFSFAPCAQIVIDSLKFCQHEKGLEIMAWCIMPNHIHLIVRSKEGFLLQDIFRDFKKFTAGQIIRCLQNFPPTADTTYFLSRFSYFGRRNGKNKNYQVWMQHNKPTELFSNKAKDRVLDYIHQNPVKAGLVENSEHYALSSASDYLGDVGPLKIVFL